MLDFGTFVQEDVIILDLVGDDIANLSKNNGRPSYETVCNWAKQMVTSA